MIAFLLALYVTSVPVPGKLYPCIQHGHYTDCERDYALARPYRNRKQTH